MVIGLMVTRKKMPNWVSCDLTLMGDVDNISLLKRDLYLPAIVVDDVEHKLPLVSFDTLNKGINLNPLQSCCSRTISDLFFGHEFITENMMLNQLVGCKWDFGMFADAFDSNTFSFNTPWSPPDKWIAWLASKYDVDLELKFCNTEEHEGGYIIILNSTIYFYSSEYAEFKRHFYRSLEEMQEFEDNIFEYSNLHYVDCLTEATKWPKTREEYLNNNLVNKLPLKEYLLDLIF